MLKFVTNSIYKSVYFHLGEEENKKLKVHTRGILLGFEVRSPKETGIVSSKITLNEKKKVVSANHIIS